MPNKSIKMILTYERERERERIQYYFYEQLKETNLCENKGVAIPM
jgi:hypothetical protein